MSLAAFLFLLVLLYGAVRSYVWDRPPFGSSLDEQAAYYEALSDSLEQAPADTAGPSIVTTLRGSVASRRERVRLGLEKVNTERKELDGARIAAIPIPASVAAIPPSPDSFQIPVFFASMRKARGGANLDRYFEDKSAGAAGTSFGIARVWVAMTPRPGNVDGPGWCRTRGIPACDPASLRRGVIAALQVEGNQGWRSHMDSALTLDSADTRADVLVFVHGFNNSFVAAAERAAGIAYNAGFRGMVTAFDWPSANSIAKYKSDQLMADSAAPTFAVFLRGIRSNPRVRRVILVAHSMGTSLVAETLAGLGPDTLPKIRHVILGAADIDSARFVADLAGPLLARSKQTTLYASSADKAMWASKAKNKGTRVGAGPPRVVLVDSIDYVDASIADIDFTNHAYISNSAAVISDIFYLLKYEEPAAKRGLPQITHPPSKYYQLAGSKTRAGP